MNRLRAISWICVPALSLTLAAFAATPPLEATLRSPEGKDLGRVKFTQLKQGVKIELQARDLPPGEHAFHIHETGKCAGPDFKSAGDHFSPSKHKHGFDVAGGPHAGDMPNLMVRADGTVQVEAINTAVTLGPGKTSLLKPEGTSLVIHSALDDYQSQPAGAAGDRIACAEIKTK